jgi:hypothetical protein
MLKDDFPQIWVPSWENRDLRQLLSHRHCMVQARTRIMNQLQAVALNEGPRCKKRLWREAGREQLGSAEPDDRRHCQRGDFSSVDLRASRNGGSWFCLPIPPTSWLELLEVSTCHQGWADQANRHGAKSRNSQPGRVASSIPSLYLAIYFRDKW